MIGWKPEEDKILRERWPMTVNNNLEEKARLEKAFGKKWGTIWKRAQRLGLTGHVGKGAPAKVAHRWTVQEGEKLFSLTERMAQPKELLDAFPGLDLKEIMAEADRISCDICYLRNRETLMKSIDMKLNVDLDLNLNIRSVNVQMGKA
jgi:hypothetical protein